MEKIYGKTEELLVRIVENSDDYPAGQFIEKLHEEIDRNYNDDEYYDENGKYYKCETSYFHEKLNDKVQFLINQGFLEYKEAAQLPNPLETFYTIEDKFYYIRLSINGENYLDYLKHIELQKNKTVNSMNIKINGSNGQINIANDNANIKTINNINMTTNDIEDIIEHTDKLIELIRKEKVNQESKERILDYIDIVKEQLISEKPKVSRMKNAIESIANAEKFFTDGATVVAALGNFYENVTKFINHFSKVIG